MRRNKPRITSSQGASFQRWLSFHQTEIGTKLQPEPGREESISFCGDFPAKAARHYLVRRGKAPQSRQPIFYTKAAGLQRSPLAVAVVLLLRKSVQFSKESLLDALALLTHAMLSEIILYSRQLQQWRPTYMSLIFSKWYSELYPKDKQWLLKLANQRTIQSNTTWLSA